MSTSDTSTRTRGTISSSAKSSRLRREVTSSFAAPSTKSNITRGTPRRAAARSSAIVPQRSTRSSENRARTRRRATFEHPSPAGGRPGSGTRSSGYLRTQLAGPARIVAEHSGEEAVDRRAQLGGSLTGNEMATVGQHAAARRGGSDRDSDSADSTGSIRSRSPHTTSVGVSSASSCSASEAPVGPAVRKRGLEPAPVIRVAGVAMLDPLERRRPRPVQDAVDLRRVAALRTRRCKRTRAPAKAGGTAARASRSR